MQDRYYQTKMKQDIYGAWDTGIINILSVLPTGAGKTHIFAGIIKDHVGASVAIAHRQELVGQISMALARFGVNHNILAPKNVIRFILQAHLAEFGATYFDPDATCVVAGVQTLIRRADDIKQWRKKVGLWVIDECHHILEKNNWGKATKLFPNAKGLGVTATPVRADGNGLGRDSDGVMDVMIEGPTMRDLITQGFLTDYRIFNPPSDLDLTTVSVSKVTGDYSKKQLSVATKKSHIVGDVVKHYLKLARGKLGVTFVTDVATATDVAGQYNVAGVPAEVVSAKTPGNIRAEIIDRFRRRELLQLVNVDLFGEGFDLPAIEVVSMARPTQSYSLFCQQFGRGLRTLADDPDKIAVIIDHVGNVKRHGLPDAYRTWSLDRRERGSRSAHDPDLIPVKTCTKCTGVYEAIYKVCPFCNNVNVIADRSLPEFVDGDLVELDVATLARMRGDIAKIDADPLIIKNRMQHAGAPAIASASAAKQHRLRQNAQAVLRYAIAQWAGDQQAMGRSDSEIYRRFYFKFNIDIMSAQALGRRDAENLTERVNA